MRELALFAGAGGGILGGRLLGWRTVCAVELDSYARNVLLTRQADWFVSTKETRTKGSTIARAGNRASNLLTTDQLSAYGRVQEERTREADTLSRGVNHASNGKSCMKTSPCGVNSARPRSFSGRRAGPLKRRCGREQDTLEYADVP